VGQSHPWLLGPEVIDQALRVLNIVAESVPKVKLEINSYLLGGAAIDATGKPLPEDTLEACKAADAVLMGMLFDLRLRPLS
jgi:3-isopropylmalate dehydrogenase